MYMHFLLNPSPAYSGILCEFLEVAIHLILYVREVYPPGETQGIPASQ